MPAPVAQGTETAQLWAGLLSWLATFDGGNSAVNNLNLVDNPAGRGLIATQDIKPNTPLVTIPGSALLNRATLTPFYPLELSAQLTATQFITLHLALQYHTHASSPSSSPSHSPSSSPTLLASLDKRSSSARDRWWPFQASLPREFPTVPLTWYVESLSSKQIREEYGVTEADGSLRERAEGRQEELRRRSLAELLRRLPASVERRAEDVKRRFKKDWQVASKVWSDHRKLHPTEPPLTFFDFHLSWLNLNSRCVFLKLSKNNADNLTLCPVIDMINHADNRQTRPLQTASNGLSFSSPAFNSTDPGLREGTELSFSYGAHEDAMLLTEYGFTLETNPFNNVEIDAVIEELFEKKGADGKIKRAILEEEGYWGEMTLQPLPAPASASWRVYVALRLLHLPIPSHANTIALEASLAPWRALVAGETETLAPRIEADVRKTIESVCERVINESDDGLDACEALREKWEKEGVDEEGLREGLRMVEGIWREEGEVAREVKKFV